MRYTKGFSIALLAVFSVFAFLSADLASAADPPLTADGKPKIAAHPVSLEKGEVELAKTWRHIEDAMKMMRGPHQS